ncbi:MAG: LysR family transcriptional regulator [Gammaproteobacteria bacterium]|jgi:molybdate transport repressor ModE-like protein|nr:LysR family transcriptional regulator [Gammaproteobacteria bacterium]MBT3725027.1 LysR family transcriptional regulator [Gammaproteobacteria bacterium]MBT4193010.1 LysR family transcriptional regulator [Gammaproteobacteria bacterium]MBT4452087.1 LysR family transcriptional regulator [Gammaproteobacteria bacterium]MBT4861106.1 LysR family transcriptional regulator [Gammaproteobacteria bacterium]
MNWDDLRLFLEVARTGSISGAAKKLNVQHSTVSRRLRKLEENLGARLIERKNTGYELTPAGENIRQAAHRMETEVLHVDGAVLGKDSNLVGPLKVTAINNMASTVLMPMFASFSKTYPQVDLHVVVSNIDSSLSQREADVAIRLTNTPTDTLIGKKLVTVASTIYGSREYLQQHRENGSTLKWIGVDCCTFHKSWTRHACDEQSHNFFSDDTLLTLSAIREGLGVSYLPCFMGDTAPQLERYCEPDPSHNLGLWILLHPDLKRTARVLVFRNHIIESINKIKALFEGNLPDSD